MISLLSPYGRDVHFLVIFSVFLYRLTLLRHNCMNFDFLTCLCLEREKTSIFWIVLVTKNLSFLVQYFRLQYLFFLLGKKTLVIVLQCE